MTAVNLLHVDPRPAQSAPEPGDGAHSLADNPDEDSEGDAMFPSGKTIDTIDVPGVGPVEATLINAGNSTIFVDAATLGLAAAELQPEVNGNAALLARCESIRANATVVMGLARTAAEATEKRPHTPKLAFVAPPAAYTASSGKNVRAEDMNLCARIFSMGTWTVNKVIMSRSARRLMEGQVYVPADWSR